MDRDWEMHLNEMNKRLESEGPYVWCDPWEVEGVDFAALKTCNERRWFRPVNVEEEPEETPDEVIVELLMYAIISGERSRLAIDGVRFVKTVAFLVCEAGSSYAANILVAKRELVQEQDARECFALLKEAYSSSTWFVRDILRDFIIDLFEFEQMTDRLMLGLRVK